MGTYKQFTGNAVVAHLTAAITGTPSSFTVDSATGFPTGAGSVPFVVTVDRGNSSEEKILCSSQGSGVFTIQTRGFDSTTQTNHSNGATVEHTIDADTLNDAQQHIHVTTRDDHTQYVRVDGSRLGTGQPAGRIYQSASQAFTNSVAAQVTSMTQDFLKGGMTFNGASNGLVVPVTGIYRVSAQVYFNDSPGQTTIYLYSGQMVTLLRQSNSLPMANDLVSLTSGTLLTLAALQASGGTLSTVSGSAYTYLSAELVSQ